MYKKAEECLYSTAPNHIMYVWHVCSSSSRRRWYLARKVIAPNSCFGKNETATGSETACRKAPQRACDASLSEASKHRKPPSIWASATKWAYLPILDEVFTPYLMDWLGNLLQNWRWWWRRCDWCEGTIRRKLRLILRWRWWRVDLQRSLIVSMADHLR